MSSTLRPLLSLAAVAFALAACDASDGKAAPDVVADTADAPPILTRVTTTVTPDTVAAGASVDVACAAFDQYDAPWATDQLAFDVVAGDGQPAEGVTQDGARVTFPWAGVYRVRCHYAGLPRVDDLSPVAVTVTAGPAASIQTNLFLTQLTAGASASVSCTVKDAAGNAAAAETTVRVTPDLGTTIAGRTVTFTAAGAFAVVCATADGALVGDDPVTVNVAPGPLAVLRTVLSAATIHPTDPVTILCPGEDRFGNTVALDKVFTLPVDGITWLDDTRLRVTSTRSGAYTLTCSPKESWVTANLIPATLTVEPGPPVALQLDLNPDRAVYTVGARVRATGSLRDAWHNPVVDGATTVTATASLGGQVRATAPNGDKLTLDAEGDWVLAVTTGPPAGLTATRAVVVDGSAPTIEIDSPARGAMILSNGSTLTVSGTISDVSGGLAEVLVNGAAQSVTPGTREWPLALPWSVRHGLNSLVIEATDVQGNRTRVTHSFLAAPSWKPPGQRFDDGLIAHLAKPFLDDGVRSAKLDDLTTIFTRVLNGTNFASFIPSPVVTYAGYDVFLENLEYDEPVLSLTPALGALNVHLRIENVGVDVDADGFIDVSGRVSMSAIDLQMAVNVAVVGGVTRATAGTTVVQVEGLNIDVHWSINWLINLFEDDVRDALAGAFEDNLRQQVPEALGDALAALSIQQAIALPAFLPGMQPVNLDLTARPTDVHLTVAGLDVDLGTAVTTLKRVPWAAPGSLERGGCFGVDGGAPAWDADKRLGFGLSTDVLNQLLFSVWWGGALEITMGQAQLGDLSDYGVSDLDVTLSGRLPPVLTDCSADTLVLQLGELHVDASLKLGGMPLDVGLIAAFETTADVTSDADGNLGLAIGAIAPEDILIDIVRVESALFGPDQEDALIELVREQLLAKVLEGLGGQSLAGFPLPEIDLGLVAPSLAGQTIAIHGVQVSRQRGYVRLQGNP